MGAKPPARRAIRRLLRTSEKLACSQRDPDSRDGRSNEGCDANLHRKKQSLSSVPGNQSWKMDGKKKKKKKGNNTHIQPKKKTKPNAASEGTAVRNRFADFCGMVAWLCSRQGSSVD